MTFKKLAGGLMAIVICLLPAGPAAYAQTAKTTLRFAHQVDGSYYLPYYVARDLGWYRQWGLDIQDVVVSGDAALTATILSGDSDVASTGPLNFYNAVERGAPIKAIGATQMTVDFLVVARPDIGSLKELAGKTFATSGPAGLPHALPKMIFQARRIDDKGTSYIAVGSQSARLQSVIAGKVDATIIDTVTSIRGVKSGGIRVIETASDYFPLISYTYDIVADASLKDPEKRRALEMFMQGIILGARLIVQDPHKAAEILHPYYSTYDLADLEDAIKKLNAQGVWPVNGGLEPAVTNFSTKFYYDTKELKTQYTVQQILDTSIIDSVLKKEGRK